MEDIIEKVLSYISMITGTLASILVIIEKLRTRHKPKH